MKEKLLVLDFGSQYAHLIVKRLRHLGYYTEIAPPSISLNQANDAKGIIFSGGPSSLAGDFFPHFNKDLLNTKLPILGLCFGHQLMAKMYNAQVGNTNPGEFGLTNIRQENPSPLFEGITFPSQVWMSHQDAVESLPEGFELIASTKDCPYAGIQNLEQKRFGLQFHIEVKDTLDGNTILENFAKFCEMEKNWDKQIISHEILEQIKKDANDKNVLLFLSGGVDSTVTFALLNKALGQERVLGLHINNGFMRKNESAIIEERYKKAGFNNFVVEDASDSFLKAVEKITDPQLKRKAVGEHYLRVREKVTKKLSLSEDAWLLAQGTLYPDIIESGESKNSHVIKTHHNRVDGIQALIAKKLIIEPLKDLYKDEVRIIGRQIGLSNELIDRHPFPGPGLSINVLCTTGVLSSEEEREKQKAEKKLNDMDFEKFMLSENINNLEFSTRVLPVKSVGVQGDQRTYRFPAILDIKSESYNWTDIEKISSHITNTNAFVNRTIICLWENENCSLQEGYCTKEALDQLREVDAIVLEELKKEGWYEKIFQHLSIHTSYASNENKCSIVLRPVVSEDVMTARFAHLDFAVLEKISQRIKALGFVDALFYDATNKPPATFAWE